MKPLLITSNTTFEKAIDCKNESIPYFYNPLHYHREIELTFVQKGFGQRIIGDSIENFSEGDLVMVGSNLPHIWKSAPCFYEPDSTLETKAVVIKFRQNFAGDIMDTKEMVDIKHLLYKTSDRGIKITGRLKELITSKVQEFPLKQGSTQIIGLLEILDQIVASDEIALLSSPAYMAVMEKIKNVDPRINSVVEYMLKNSNRSISLDDLSELIHMNKNAFCRFFKAGTGKTVGNYLLEIRIKNACQKLVTTNESIEFISSEVGYGNYSNFNKAFHKITQMSPLMYRKANRKVLGT